MISFISTALNSLSSSSATSAAAPQPTVATPHTATQKSDTVHLSLTSQMHQLKSSGQSAKQIAASLGVTEASVDQALGLSGSGAASVTAGLLSALPE